MSKYGNSVGIWTPQITGFDHELKPKKGDARNFLRLVTNFQQHKNQDTMFNDFQAFISKIIERDVPPNTPEEKEELELFVEFNLLLLFEEAQIAFRLATREQIEQQKKAMLQTPIEGVKSSPSKSLGLN